MTEKFLPKILSRQAMIPAEHGSWVFLFSPLFIGLASVNEIDLPVILVCLAALAGFMARQPLTLLIKVLSRRRSKKDLPAALWWLTLYGLISSFLMGYLTIQGFGFILWLALPTSLVLGWHLWLVSRRSERKNVAVEIAGSGVLAFVAPAIHWVGAGRLDWMGMLLWALCWLQATVSIFYAFYRLEQRSLGENLTPGVNIRMAVLPLAGAILGIGVISSMVVLGWISSWVIAAFAIQLIEIAWGFLHPAVGWKPAKIGIRQLIVSSLFTVVFILAW
jgi:hypothetical protein